MIEQFNFKKKFGQNFLRNEAIVKKIVTASSIKENSLIIEVGPGSGALTKQLAVSKPNVELLCYEIDSTLEDILTLNLSGFDNVTVCYGDFLKQNLKEDVLSFAYSHLYFVSNVPYYITTPILFHLIESDLYFDKIVMMVQKEVGERFTASPGRKEYGALTVLLRYAFQIRKEFLVDRNQFVPRPNVDSIVVSFTPKKEKETVKDWEFFQKLVHDSFQYKRKMIRNNLKNYDLKKVDEVLKTYGYDLMVRAEQLDYHVFVTLANKLS